MDSGSEQARTTHARQPTSTSDVRPLSGSASFSVAEGQPPQLVTGHAGDHALVYSLLRAVNQAPAQEDFISWMDEPSYEPSDRLLVKHGEQIVGHAQLLHRTASFHGIRLPVAGMQDLAVLPEYVPAGYERLLIDAAERVMREGRAVVSLVRTERPEPLISCGWAEVRVPGYSRACVGDVLAHLSAQRRQGGVAGNRESDRAMAVGAFSRRSAALAIRRWRHVELRSVRTVYDAVLDDRWGALCRTDQYWQWLVGRSAHSGLIVAVQDDEELSDSEAESRIVGYAVTHGSQVLELCCWPGFARAAPRLLARACQDAIERDYHTISLHTPACDPLHELMVTAGGTWCTDRGAGGVLLVKLLDPPRCIEAMFPLLRRRAKTAGIARPCHVGFDVDSKRWRLNLTRRSSRLIEDDAAVPDVLCDRAAFADLLTCNLETAELLNKIRPVRANDGLIDKLAALFPPALFWQSQFDALRF
ncbi:MAG: GNAT family N-acetyltransferase [Pirellulales bacterium]